MLKLFTQTQYIAFATAFVLFLVFVDFKKPSVLDWFTIVVYGLCAVLIIIRVILFTLKNKK